jgi:hypothetical protein
MKTTKMISALSLALILFAAISASSAPIDKKNGQPAANPAVNHHVNVLVRIDKPLCNYYQVEILDGNGRLVAPPKAFVPGVTAYDFYERGPASGIRIAALVLSPAHSHFVCDTELFTAPVVISGPFESGRTYRYDLFPKTQISREE